MRITSLVPSLTETLFAFGLGDSIVGVTDYCTQPPEGVAAKARIGGTKNPNNPIRIDSVCPGSSRAVLSVVEGSASQRLERRQI